MRKTLIPHQLSKPLRLGPYSIYLFFNWSRRAEGPLYACLLAQAAAPLNPRFPCTPTLVGERSWDSSLCRSDRKQTRDLPSSRGRGPNPPAPNSRIPTGQTGPFCAWGRVRQCPALSKAVLWVGRLLGGGFPGHFCLCTSPPARREAHTTSWRAGWGGGEQQFEV